MEITRQQKRTLQRKYPNSKTAIELLLEIDKKFNSDNYVCRGHADSNWELSSTYYRNKKESGEEYEFKWGVQMGIEGRGTQHTPVIKRTLSTMARMECIGFPNLVEIHENCIKWDMVAFRHYDIPTEEIDFSMGYKAPIYFACSECPNSDGKIIFLKRNHPKSNAYEFISVPKNKVSRADIQESIFVKHPDGIIPPDDYDELIILKSLKKQLLEILDKSYNLRHETVLPDNELYPTNFNKNAEYHFRYGHLLFQHAKDFPKAKEQFERAMHLNPNKYGVMEISRTNGTKEHVGIENGSVLNVEALQSGRKIKGKLTPSWPSRA